MMLTGTGKTGQGVTAFDVADRKKANTGRPSVSGPASTHRPKTGNAVVDAVNALPPNVNPNITDYQPFRKGDALSVDTVRIDAGTGEGAYNPSDPMFKLSNQVRQAYVGLQKRYSAQGIVTPTDVVSVIPTALTTSGGGGGGGGGGGAEPDAAAPTTWWGGLSTLAKVAIIGGGAAVVGFGIYKLSKGRGGAAGPSSKRARH